MKVAIITANLGSFDPIAEYVPQSIPVDVHRFTDENFPPRINSMTPRLQARIPKCFGWQFCPGYDFYIWVDASCSLQHPDSAWWFVEQCKGYDAAFFLHPDRRTIKDEATFIKKRIAEGNSYLTSRYAGEFLDDQLAHIQGDPRYVDNTLFASTAFVYRDTPAMRTALISWWFHISRYHSVDQVSLPYVLKSTGASFRCIPDSYLKIPYLTYTRNRKAA